MTVTDPAVLPAGHRRALDRLLTVLGSSSIDWALTGSTSFAIQGVAVKPADIDVQTDEAGARHIDTALSSSIAPLRYVENPAVRSWLGTYRIAGVDVDVIGDLEKRVAGEWSGPTDVRTHREWVSWRGEPVPVLSLEYEAEAYEQLGRTARARLLRAHLDNAPGE